MTFNEEVRKNMVNVVKAFSEYLEAHREEIIKLNELTEHTDYLITAFEATVLNNYVETLEEIRKDYQACPAAFRSEYIISARQSVAAYADAISMLMRKNVETIFNEKIIKND